MHRFLVPVALSFVLLLGCGEGAVSSSEGAELFDVPCDFTKGPGGVYFAIQEFPGRTWWDLSANVGRAFGPGSKGTPSHFADGDYYGAASGSTQGLGFADGKVAAECWQGETTVTLIVRR